VTPPADAGIAPLVRDDTDMPEPSDEAPLADGQDDVEARSLLDDVHALIDDGKTYLETELAFQKTRVAFVADGAKSAMVYGIVAALLAFLALVGLTVGAIIALAPVLTAWGASALVVALLLAAAALAGRAAARKWKGLMRAIAGAPDKAP
jgi:hypothetical protein